MCLYATSYNISDKALLFMTVLLFYFYCTLLQNLDKTDNKTSELY